MDDYISRQAAIDALGEEPEIWCETDEEAATRSQWEMDKAAIESVQPADVVPVVRCRNCKYAHMTYSGDCKYCDRIKEMTDDGDGGYGGSLYLPGDWFCAYGERREDGN